MLKLSIQDSEGRNNVVPLSDGELSIGRDQANHICLPDRNVSRQHARVVTKNGHVWIENVAATYGTRFNNLLLRERTEVKKGDVLQVGDYTLELIGENAARRDTALVDSASPASAPPASAPPASAAPAGAPVPLRPQAGPGASAGKGVDGATAIVNLADIQSALKDSPMGEAKSIPEGQQPRLMVESENLRGLELRITKTPIVVGRVREAADLVIDHRSISKEHARLTRLPDGNWQVLDLGSANGMKVNGEPYSKCDLNSGDRLELGHVTLRFLAAGAKAPALDAGGGRSGATGGSSKLPFLIGGVVLLVAAVVGGVLLAGKKTDDKAAQPASEAGGKADDDKAERLDDKKAGATEPAGKLDVDGSIEKADRLAQAGMFDEALTALKQAEKDNPGNAQLTLQLNLVERDVKAKSKLDEAESVLKSNPSEAQRLAKEAKKLLHDRSSQHERADKLAAAEEPPPEPSPAEKKAAQAPVPPKPAAVKNDAREPAKPEPKKTEPEPKKAEPREAAKPEPKKDEPKKEEPKKEEPKAADGPKTGKELYDEGRQKVLAGDKDGAIVSFKAAIKGGVGKAYGQLARLYFEKGDKGACASAAKSYLDKYPDAGDAPQIQSLLEKCGN